MEEEEPDALEMGQEEAQAAEKKDEEARRRALSLSFPLFPVFSFTDTDTYTVLFIFFRS